METTDNSFERNVRNFILNHIEDEITLYDFMYGYEMFQDFSAFSCNECLKSALAKILVETKIIETKELYKIDLYKINQELLNSIDLFKLKLDRCSTRSWAFFNLKFIEK